MELTWSPSFCSGEKPTMIGALIIKAPSYPEKLRLQAKAQSAKAKTDDMSAQLMLIAELADTAKEMIVSVNLEMLDGSSKASSADELYHFSQFDGVISELAVAVLQGFSGNSISR